MYTRNPKNHSFKSYAVQSLSLSSFVLKSLSLRTPRIGRRAAHTNAAQCQKTRMACTSHMRWARARKSVRQDVYACLKCAQDGDDGEKVLAGFCTERKPPCHSISGSSMIDLYSKGVLRCDCGNCKMINKCILYVGKRSENPENHRVYNHNFQRKYCRCDCVYERRLGNMQQCAICEDWCEILSFPLIHPLRQPQDQK